jgi:hypothetical protein
MLINRLITHGRQSLKTIFIQKKLLKNLYYQNFTYNAARMSSVATIIAVIAGFNLNISLSSANAFGFTLGPVRLIATIMATVKKNAQPMLIRNGIS